jgi:glyoxylase-like metal-dependent hydrolase (beta-lactamase superfamily II)
MRIDTLQLGVLGANCHIIDCGGGVCAAVDIGGDAEILLQFLDAHHLTLKAILLTHGHFDHIGDVEAVREKTGAQVYIHEADAPMLGDVRRNLAYQISPLPFRSIREYRTVTDGEALTIGERVFTVLHTPGHTSGSVCYLTETAMFSGDTLFSGSIGRTDLGGNVQEMRSSLQKLSALDGDYDVYSGHGAATSLDVERRTNPYMRSL